MEEMSLKEFLLMIKKRLWLVIFFTIIPVLVSGIIGFNKPKVGPDYNASITILIGGPKAYINDEGELDYNAYKEINGRLMSNFTEIVKTETVADEVIDKLELNISYEDFSEKLNVTLVENTEMIKIDVKDKSPKLATKIVDEISKVSSKKAKEIMGTENVQVVDRIQTIPIPVESKSKVKILMSGILGFMASVLIVFFLEYMDNTIKTPEDIEKYLDLSVTGIVPETGEGLIMKEKPNSFAAESYRTLRTNIQTLEINNGIKSVLITSSTPNEGKNAVAVNIAMAINQGEEKVLLIDGDLRNPKIHSFFQVNNDCGLSNILNENLDYKKAINEIEENLHILTAGSSLSNPGNLLASKNMKLLLENISDEYDIVIINSPSLGGISDAAVLSTIVDGTMLVCATRQTNIDEIKKGKELLDKANGNIIGVILSKVNLEKDSYYKYYYDSYSYYDNSSIEI